jgi:hypothetical protein
LPGIPPPGIFNRLQEAMKRTAWSSATSSVSKPAAETPGGNVVHKTPLFMRVLENPVVRNNAAWSGLKSIEKHWFSTVFLGFYAYLA